MIYRLFAFAALMILLLPGCRAAQNAADENIRPDARVIAVFESQKHDWPHGVSDLDPDPRLHFGRLKNGLRYVILPEDGADTGMSLRFQVSAGFLEDPKGQEGITHLLEHMAFRGSKNVAPDDMLKQLEALGLSSGQDSNAFTFPGRTMYKFDFPERSQKNLEKGLFLFSEIAQNLTLDPELLEIERGVVLAEGELRDSPAFRMQQERLQFSFPQAQRWQSPIVGTKETLGAITAQDLRIFYNQYYRPNMSVLIVTGAVEVKQAERIIDRYFGGWSAVESEKPQPQPQDLEASKPEAFFQGNVGTEVIFVKNIDRPKTPDTETRRKAQLIESLAIEMFNTRLKERSEDIPRITWMNGAILNMPYGGIISGGVGSSHFKTGPGVWDNERRHVLETGFSEDEISNAIKAHRHKLERAMSRKFSAPRAANQMAKVHQLGTVFESNAQLLSRLDAAAESASKADYDAAFARLYKDFDPRIWVTGKNVSEETLGVIRKTLSASRDKSLKTRNIKTRAAFKIDGLGPKGAISKTEDIRGTKVKSVTYENGVRLNYQKVTHEPDRIVLNVSLRPDFNEVLPYLRRYQDMAGSMSMEDIKGYSKADMETLFVGQDVLFRARWAGQNFNFTVFTSPDDVDAALSVVTAFFKNPDLSSREWKAKYSVRQHSNTRRRNASPISLGASNLDYYLSGENEVFSSSGAYLNVDMRRQLERLIERSAIEIGASGDFDPETLKEAVAQTLGALPDRPREFPKYVTETPDLKFTDEKKLLKTHPGDDDQMSLHYCWPLSGNQNPKTRRLERVASEILTHRMTDSIRRDLGATYSAYKNGRHNWQLPDFAYLCGGLQFEPRKEKEVRNILRSVTDDIVNGQVSRADFNRAVAPLRSAAKSDERSLGNLADQALFAASKTSWVKDRMKAEAHYKALRLSDLKAELKTIFKPGEMRLIRMVSRDEKVEAMIRSTEIEAELGDVDAMIKMAEQNKSVGYTERDDSKVIYWYERAAKAGSLEGAFEVGEIFAALGDNQDFEKAQTYLLQASQGGHSKAKYRLAKMYQSEARAFPEVKNEDIMALLLESANMGHKYAMEELAQRYIEGAMVPRNYQAAYMWALTSDYFGNRQIGRDGFNYYTDELSPEKQVLAQKESEYWIAQFKTANPDYEVDYFQ